MEQEPNTIMMKLLGPVKKFVNRPWKMYIVGVLFGLGFDTASSIALLSLSAIAKGGSNGQHFRATHIIILPFMFTSGMSFIDSLDSVIMTFSYTGILERKKNFRLLEKPTLSWEREPKSPTSVLENADEKKDRVVTGEQPALYSQDQQTESNSEAQAQLMRLKQYTTSNLGITLTLMSIVLAFSVSVIVTMGLIETVCDPCNRAAGDPDGGGLAGRWWRFWASANDNFGYIGAGTVACFIVAASGFYLTKGLLRRFKKNSCSQERGKVEVPS